MVKVKKVKIIKEVKDERKRFFRRKQVSDSPWCRSQWSAWGLWRVCSQAETEVFLDSFWEGFIIACVHPEGQPALLCLTRGCSGGITTSSWGSSLGLRNLLKGWSLSIKPLAGKVEPFCHGPCEYRPAPSRCGKRGNAVQIVTYQSAWKIRSLFGLPYVQLTLW